MNQNIIYIGLDVDDSQYHGSALKIDTGEVMAFKCRPTLKGLLGQLDRLHKGFRGGQFRLCYEASYVGYTLQRDLVSKGYRCDVVAPTSIPSPRGKQVKTDRIDATQLAQFYASGLLTLVSIPELEQEQDRDLLRSRQKLLDQQTELRKHIQALLRRNGRHFKAETHYKTHWTQPHYAWLVRTLEAASGSFKVNQRGYRWAGVSKRLKARRKNTAPEMIAIADRCIKRLNKKGNRLLMAGKHPNKVKVACAREMVGFVWESLHKVAEGANVALVSGTKDRVVVT